MHVNATKLQFLALNGGNGKDLNKFVSRLFVRAVILLKG
jgi:hypothetical protein